MKNYKGGYKLIDLEKNDMLSIEVGVVIKGIHKAIESSYNKPLLLTGIVIDGVKKNDVYIEELKVVDGSFVFKAYGYVITISADDEVSCEKDGPKSFDVTKFSISKTQVGELSLYEYDINSTVNVIKKPLKVTIEKEDHGICDLIFNPSVEDSGYGTLFLDVSIDIEDIEITKIIEL